MGRPSLLASTFVVAVASAVLAASPALAAPVKVWTVKSGAVKTAAPSDASFTYAFGETFDVRASACKGGVPIAAGWTSPYMFLNGPSFRTDSKGAITDGYSLRRTLPTQSTSTRAYTVCASGPVGARVKRAANNAVVSCQGATALGFISLNSPTKTGGVSSTPVGRSGWKLTSDPVDKYASSSAVCVAKAAFSGVTSTTARGTLAAGSRTVTVTASCPRGRRALAWGYDAPGMPDNRWTDLDNSMTKMDAPFVEAAVPSAGAWKLTFATPDGKPAVTAAEVAARAVCGVPRVR